MHVLINFWMTFSWTFLVFSLSTVQLKTAKLLRNEKMQFQKSFRLKYFPGSCLHISATDINIYGCFRFAISLEIEEIKPSSDVAFFNLVFLLNFTLLTLVWTPRGIATMAIERKLFTIKKMREDWKDIFRISFCDWSLRCQVNNRLEILR